MPEKSIKKVAAAAKNAVLDMFFPSLEHVVHCDGIDTI